MRATRALAADFAWSFTTGATADTTAPTVTSTDPTDLKTNVALNKAIAALSPNTVYTATIAGGTNGVEDSAGNALASDEVWTFTTGTQIAQAPIGLGRAAPFAVMATASISGTGNSIVGDVGLNPGSAQGIPPSEIDGDIHVTNQTIIDAQTDLLAAYNDAVSRTVTSQSLPGNMGGLTFTPGLYTNSSSVLVSGAGPSNNVTLDAQGDENAIFIFKMSSTLSTGPGAQVILTGNAKASNVFWQVGTSATLDTTTIFKGNILAAVTITVNNGSDVEGRLLGGSNTNGSVTVNASTVTVPAA
ncbi:MAG: ice-binding family protein [Planctomycetota bacterium]|nr:ice-binding family protein [Planctomycetota bacterium]